jgi:hypothetical protein
MAASQLCEVYTYPQPYLSATLKVLQGRISEREEQKPIYINVNAFGKAVLNDWRRRLPEIPSSLTVVDMTIPITDEDVCIA